MLKPGGKVLLRDYGWGDLPMCRFGKGKLCDDGFYGTCLQLLSFNQLSQAVWRESQPLLILFSFVLSFPIVRGDGTRGESSCGKAQEPPVESPIWASQSSSLILPVYFFSPEELTKMFNAGPPPTSSSPRAVPIPLPQVEPQTSESNIHSFETVQLAVDRRLLVNRKEQKKMYRVWMQLKLKKLEEWVGSVGVKMILKMYHTQS